VSSYSHSKIELFRKCGRAYEFRYVLDEKERFSTIERHMGTAVHDTLRWLYDERRDGRRPTAEAAARRYDRCWNAPALESSLVIKSGVGADDYRADGLRMVQGYFDRRFGEDDSETLLLEQPFRMKLDGGTLFTGIIDRLARRADGRLHVVDYKTGSRVGNPETDPQLAFYALYVFSVHPVDEVDLTYEDLRSGSANAAILRRDRCGELERRLLDGIATIEAAERYDPSPSVLCRWCGFNPICDAAGEFVTSAREPAPRSATARSTTTATGRDCPTCGAPLRQRNGRFGSFVGCSAYPDCRYTRDAW